MPISMNVTYKKLKRIGLILLFLVFIKSSSFAQLTGYKSAAGFRLGNSSGITGKIGFGNKMALEGILTTRWSGINFTALVEIVNPLVDTPGLGWYYGGGAHLGFWDDPGNAEKNTQLFIGVDGIVGMEYTFSDIPLNLSLDWKPMFNILATTDFI